MTDPTLVERLRAIAQKEPPLGRAAVTARALEAADALDAIAAERDYWKADSAAKGHVLQSGVVVPSDKYADAQADRDRLAADVAKMRDALTKISASTGCFDACPCWQKLRDIARAALAGDADAK
jgi:hypothetical protein